MCHLVLLMPLLALPIFWLVPVGYAVPVYLLITMASGLVYWMIIKAASIQPATGAESLIGAEGTVVSAPKTRDYGQYLVRADGELWSANSPEILSPGAAVRITAVDGIIITVGQESEQANSMKRGKNARHCH